MILIGHYVFTDVRDRDTTERVLDTIRNLGLEHQSHRHTVFGVPLIWIIITGLHGQDGKSVSAATKKIRESAQNPRLLTPREAKRRGFYRHSTTNLSNFRSMMNKYIILSPDSPYSIVINAQVLESLNPQYTALFPTKEDALVCLAS